VGKSEMLGITSMDPTSSLLMHPSHLRPPQKNERPLFYTSGLSSADSIQNPNSDTYMPVTSTMNIY